MKIKHIKYIKNILIISLVFLLSFGLFGNDIKKDNSSTNKGLVKTILTPFRKGKPFFFTKRGKLARYLYNAIYDDDNKWVKELLEDGADPNYCRGDAGWVDSNPLTVLAEGFYFSYYDIERGQKVPDPIPDIDILNLLIKFGADINRRPYVWARINSRNNKNFTIIKKNRDISMDSEEMKNVINGFVNDHNRLIEAFIKAGANPDMIGHPYPFSWQAVRKGMNDKKAKKYFEKGTRPINEAIKKGILWESQVDLLLKYVELDEDSLKAAKQSGDQKMIEKIDKLWKKQQRSE